MKQETIKRIVAMIEKEEPGTDVLLVTHNANTGMNSVLCGNPTSIARTLFTVTYDKQNVKHANDIYNIIKNVAGNIVMNSSPMANDLKALMKKNMRKNGK